MSPGTVITAKNQYGEIKIVATGKFTREYSWNNQREEFELFPREQRWHGMKGIYRPYWGIGNTNNHTLLEEGQQHFCDKTEMLDFIKNRTANYNSSGLMVNWKVEHNKKPPLVVLYVEVVQLYLNGKKPENLKGARDDAMNIVFPKGKNVPQVGSYIPSCPQQLYGDGRWYSGRSIDAIKDHNLSINYIESTIKKGTPEKIGADLCYKREESSAYKSFLFVCTDRKGKVVSVVP